MLVNNAGIGEEFTLEELTPAAWERSVAINLRAPTFLAKELKADLVSQRGAILNVSSDGGVAGSLHGAPYGATKAGLIGLTKTLARELAPDVRCNAIAPGPVATEMWFAIDPAVQAQVMEREMPLKRIAQPEDIARAGLDISAWPDASGIVTVMCCCKPVCLRGSYGVRLCQQRQMIRLQARPRVRSARRWLWPRWRALA